jgi:[histone H3]-lysine4 N-trimethyltransferase SETD1
VEAVAAPLTSTSPTYKFCFACGSDQYSFVDNVLDLQRKRAANKAEREQENASGCARTEGIRAVARSGGSGRITRALVRSAEEETGNEIGAAFSTKKGDDRSKADGNLVQSKYHQMKSIPIDQRLVARRSHIHGWGLFTKTAISKDSPVVEYMGETIRQPIADKREKEYELSGEGSCYMFRLDAHRIVDATMIGSMARFMNHSCSPNAYAKIISVDTDLGPDKKIVVCAIRDIAAGEEITYGRSSVVAYIKVC